MRRRPYRVFAEKTAASARAPSFGTPNGWERCPHRGTRSRDHYGRKDTKTEAGPRGVLAATVRATGDDPVKAPAAAIVH
jgi:hypothetical protein